MPPNDGLSSQGTAAILDRLHGELVRLGLEVERRNRLNVHQGTKEQRDLQQRVFTLRDSLLFRAGSLVWHLEGMREYRTRVEQRFKADLVAALEAVTEPLEIRRYQRRQFFLFDDVVFNTLSFYDYLGNLISVSRLGGRKGLWETVVKQCRCTPSRADPALAHLVVRTNDAWVGVLDQFRDDVIHYEARLGEGEATFDEDTRVAEWRVWVPEPLKAKLALFSRVEEKIEVVDGAALIVDEALRTGAEIAHCVWDKYPRSPPPWAKKAGTLPP
jgi:hypothetical protein